MRTYLARAGQNLTRWSPRSRLDRQDNAKEVNVLAPAHQDEPTLEGLFEPLQPDSTVGFTEWSFIADRAELDEVAQPDARISFSDWTYIGDRAELAEVATPVRV